MTSQDETQRDAEAEEYAIDLSDKENKSFYIEEAFKAGWDAAHKRHIEKSSEIRSEVSDVSKSPEMPTSPQSPGGLAVQAAEEYVKIKHALETAIAYSIWRPGDANPEPPGALVVGLANVGLEMLEKMRNRQKPQPHTSPDESEEIEKLKNEIKDLKWQVGVLGACSEDWMTRYDMMVEKYEPLVGVVSEAQSHLRDESETKEKLK